MELQVRRTTFEILVPKTLLVILVPKNMLQNVPGNPNKKHSVKNLVPKKTHTHGEYGRSLFGCP
eukprot:5951577-Amphidinium_carterae.1